MCSRGVHMCVHTFSRTAALGSDWLRARAVRVTAGVQRACQEFFKACRKHSCFVRTKHYFLVVVVVELQQNYHET